MSNRSMNTHRRAMRAVTPVGRIGRNAAGAAIAAGILVGGAGAANAGGEAQADGPAAVRPEAQVPSTVAPEAKQPVAIPVTGTEQPGASFAGAAATAAPSVKIVEPEPVVEAAPAASTEDTEQAAKTEKKSEKKSSSKKSSTDDSAKKSSSATKSSTDDQQGEDQQSDEDAPKASSTKSSKKSSSSQSSDEESTGSSEAAPQAASGSSIVDTARSGIGVRYVYAGSTRSGWDCSGFTSWVYAQHGISLPHSASGQRAMGTTISASEARPGDLVYTPGHVGIYAGNGRIIDAGTSAGTTSERSMWSASWTYVRIG